jgi:hypothetical protein
MEPACSGDASRTQSAWLLIQGSFSVERLRNATWASHLRLQRSCAYWMLRCNRRTFVEC